MKKTLIFQDAQSQKFWTIETDGKKHTVTYGRLGSQGTSSTKEFASDELCLKDAESLVKSKIKKGYAESDEEKVKNTKDEAKKFAYTYEDSEEGKEPKDLAEKILKYKKLADLKHITIGYWGGESDTDCQPLVDMFVQNKEKFQHIESLFFGDMTYEENEVSWIEQASYEKLFDALPNLKSLTVKGSNGLRFGKVTHKNLEELTVICGGLGKDTIDDIVNSKFPALKKLNLYLGIEDYGFDADIELVSKLISKKKFPKLEYLGLVDSEIEDEIAEAVVASDILPQLSILDLSKGMLSDKGAEHLVKNADKLAHLKLLDLHHHYMSEEMMDKIKKLACKVDISDAEDPDEEYKNVFLSE